MSLEQACSKIKCGPFGSVVKADEYTEIGIPFLRGFNFQGGLLDDSRQIAFIPLDVHQRIIATECHAGDLIFSQRGNVGTVGILSNRWEKYNISANLIYARLHSSIDSAYVAVYFQTKYGQANIARRSIATTLPKITTDDVKAFLVPLPPRPVQEYIGAKVRLAERCCTRARELRQQVQDVLNKWYKEAPIELTQVHSFLVEPLELDSPRLDSWHYQPHYRRVVQWCRQHQFIPVSSIASLAKHRWSPKQSQQSSFHYTEISDVDVSTGRVEGKELLTSEAPGRARQLIRAFDVLISTVRPERKGVGIASADMDGWVASTGFSILETEAPEMAHFLCATLRHDVSTLQMMRWNTGATYPAIDADVPLNVLVPNLSSEARSEIGKGFQSAIKLDNRAADLVREAKADVEALIEGRLDVEGIVAGRVQPPTWEDVEV